MPGDRDGRERRSTDEPRGRRHESRATVDPGSRRGFLAGAVGIAAVLAGCVSAPGRSPARDREPAGSDDELPVPTSELVRGAPRDGIPAITDPAFGDDWSGISMRVSTELRGEVTIEPRLAPHDRVVGVERGGEARAYPLKVLNWHEIANDTFDGPLLVSFCPLCGSGLVAERRVDGEATQFGVSGLLYDDNLVMYDRATDSLWSQIRATAIRGPATGEVLRIVPSTLTRYETWTAAHPDTDVLLPPPRSDTVRGAVTFDYQRDRDAGYASSRQTGVGDDEFEDDRLHPKTTVIGIVGNGQARAYPLGAVEDAGVINDEVGDRPVVVAAGPDRSPSALEGTLVAYDRRVDGRRLRFERGDRRHLAAGGSLWRIATGRAVDGPHEGTRLRQANDASPMFWFAWLDVYPDTELYGGG